MKKLLMIMLAMILVFAFTACGNDFSETAADVAEAPAATADAGDGAVAESEEGANYEPEPEPLVPSGSWYAIDKFSGEVASGVKLYIYESSADEVVFDYCNAQGRTANGISATVSDGTAYVSLGNGIELNMTFSGSEITVDEIEGMGAMAYIFRQ